MKAAIAPPHFENANQLAVSSLNISELLIGNEHAHREIHNKDFLDLLWVNGVVVLKE